MDLSQLEKIKPFCIAPWSKGANISITSKEEALRKAQEAARQPLRGRDISIFTNGSIQNSISGIGAALGDGQPLFHQTIGKARPNYLTELEAICHMVKFVERASKQARHTKHELFIFSSSQSTLKALAKPRQQTGQRLLKETIDAVRSLERRGHQVSFH